VLVNDSDAEGSVIASLLAGPAHASAFTLNANGSFSYTHDGSETTTDSFTYRAFDGAAFSNVATVTITVAPVNDPPVIDLDADDSSLATGGNYQSRSPRATRRPTSRTPSTRRSPTPTIRR